MIFTSDISSLQDDIRWYLAQRSDGEFAMFPRNHARERGEDTVEATMAVQAPLKAEAGMTDVPDRDETVAAIPSKHGEVKLSDMQVRSSKYKGN